MKFELKSALNGLILKVDDDDEIVYQEEYEDEHNAFANFLRIITDHYGPQESRYSEKRIYVVVHPGDKHPDFTNEIFS